MKRRIISQSISVILRRLLFTALFCAFLMVPGLFQAWPGAPEVLPGWPPSIGNRPLLSSICLADIDGDGAQDVLIGTYGEEPNVYTDGLICIWDGAGNPLPGWPVVTSGPIPATPSVADLDGNGSPEVVVGSWNRLYVLGYDGSNHPGWPKSYSISNTAALANMGGDVDLEIVFVSGGTIRIADHDGTVTAARSLGGNLSNPAVGDVDGDGTMEVAVQTSERLVYVLESDLGDSPGWPQSVPGETWMNNRAPALGDLDADGYLEILSDIGGSLYAFRHDGTVMTGWPQSVQKYCNNMPVCLDLDLNGDLEVLSAKSASGSNRIYVFDHDGSDFGDWPLDPGMQPESAPVVGDLDGDGFMELALNFYNYLGAYDDDTTTLDGWPVTLSDYSHTGTWSPSPAIGDINGDGLADIVAASNFKDVFAYTVNESYDPALMEWPMVAHNARHTACYSAPVSCTFCDFPDPPGTVDPNTTVFLEKCYINECDTEVTFTGDFKVYLRGNLVRTVHHPPVVVPPESEECVMYRTVIPAIAAGRRFEVCNEGLADGAAYSCCFTVNVNPL